jgi:hypothetical protein
MEIKDLLYEIDFALDSILPIEERVVEKRSTTKIMLTISQLRGCLLKLRDNLVVKNNIRGRRELYHPLEALPLEGMRMLYDDMPDNLAEKHFNQTAYNRMSKQRKEFLERNKDKNYE